MHSNGSLDTTGSGLLDVSRRSAAGLVIITMTSRNIGSGVRKDYNALGITSADLSPLSGSRKYAGWDVIYERGLPFDASDAMGMFDPASFEPESYKVAAARLDLRAFLEENPAFYPTVKRAFLTEEGFANSTVRFYNPTTLFAPIEMPKCAAAVKLDSPKAPKNSEVVRIVGTESYAPPNVMGLYDILVGTGDKAECYVFPSMVTIGEGSTNVGLMVNKESGAYSLVFPGAMISVSDRSTEKIDSVPKDISSVNVGATGILVCNGSVTLPFKVKAKKEGEWTVVPASTYERLPFDEGSRSESSDTASPSARRSPFVRSDYQSDVQGEPCCASPGSPEKYTAFRGDERTIAFRKVPDFSPVRSTLIVSKDAKFFPIEDKKIDSSARPAPLSFLDGELRKVASRIDLYAGNGAYQVRGDLQTQAIRRDGVLGVLVDDLALTGSDAEALIKSAEQDGTVSCWIIKHADYTNPQLPPEQPDGVNSMLGVTEHRPNRQFAHGQSDYRPPSLEEMLNAGREAVTQAAETGQKEVFDASGLARILSGPDAGDQARKYLGDLQRVGLDRLGRMLLLYYWQNDAFREQYGDENMREVEDALRGAYKALSRAVLLLLDRAPDMAFSLRAQPSDVVESGMS